MADILRAFDKLMDLEGGGKLHTVEGDPGGMTKWGFSQRAHPEVDIAALTKLDAVWLFEAKYWTPLRCHEITHNQMAFEVAEFAFNAGDKASVMAAQEAANDLMGAARSRAGRVQVDGRIGPKTIGILNRVDRMGGIAVFGWVSRFNLLQLRYYRQLRPELVKRFFVGWTRRVIE